MKIQVSDFPQIERAGKVAAKVFTEERAAPLGHSTVPSCASLPSCHAHSLIS